MSAAVPSAPRTCRVRCRGLTIVEVLIALTVLAVAGAALASVQLGALRSGRAAQVRHTASDALAVELLFQRVGPAAQAGGCVVAALPAAWECSVHVSCPVAEAACGLQVISVTITPPEGRPLQGVTARYQALVGGP